MSYNFFLLLFLLILILCLPLLFIVLLILLLQAVLQKSDEMSKSIQCREPWLTAACQHIVTTVTSKWVRVLLLPEMTCGPDAQWLIACQSSPCGLALYWGSVLFSCAARSAR